MGRRAVAVIAAVCLIAVMGVCLVSCSEEEWNDGSYDLSLPDFLTAQDFDKTDVSGDGWYMVFEDDFDGDSSSSSLVEALNASTSFGEVFKSKNPELFSEGEILRGIWTTSPEGLRWESNDSDKPEQACYWCSDMVSVGGGYVTISSEQRENHVCTSGVCPSSGRFTSGIETRAILAESDSQTENKGQADDILFAQAFGYFEATVKFPDADGMWSAFWLQSSNMRKIGAEGVDGTEIDIYESAFRKARGSKMGHALLWNGYGAYAKVEDYIGEAGVDLYDGNFHTFALKWTPDYYVFYIDGAATWASRGGGVSHVREFLRLTVELDAGDKYGPHGQKIGAFSGGADFIIDSVRVYQNENYEQYIIDDSRFAGDLDLAN